MFKSALTLLVTFATLASALYVGVQERDHLPRPDSVSGRVHPNYNQGKCATVGGGVQADGTPVILFDCDDSGWQDWVLNPGDTKVVWAGTEWCLTSDGANNVVATITKCSDDNPNQNWYYTDDKRLARTGTGKFDSVNASI
ncbi:hypothetical protein ONZ45_g5147 [Pleurotus djamor]|nr:hypothetical protein ONZ45_g5147 [Pleurotus djamor]